MRASLESPWSIATGAAIACETVVKEKEENNMKKALALLLAALL